MPTKKKKAPVTTVSQLADDEKCIYQAMNALEGIGMDTLGEQVMASKKVKEVDDEGAVVVLTEKYGYAGPKFATGAEFAQAKLGSATKVFVVITQDTKIKNCAAYTGKDATAMTTMMLDPTKMGGVNMHAFGVTISKGTRVILDKQGLRKTGPVPNDAVLYWTK
jgi:hypothetical protein